MEQLWSVSTTIREAERIMGFLRTAAEIDGEEWTTVTQAKYQILLVKNRQYLNDPDNTQSFNKLSPESCRLLKDKSIVMTYEQAAEIIKQKQYEGGPEMRGRQSMSPLYKLGLVYKVKGKITVTDVGHKLLRGDINFGDFMLDSLLKFQYPNPYENGYNTWNTKPFINTLRLIKRVNQICEDNGLTPRGISKIEFGIFVLSLKSYEDIDFVAEKILEFRTKYRSIKDDKEKEAFRKQYVEEYLSDFKNPVNNTLEYTDNMIRYIRLTKYIYIRGKYSNIYIDLEPRRMTEINAILENDNGASVKYTKEEWRSYMGTYGTYKLPFETIEKLKEILDNIQNEIQEIQSRLGMQPTPKIECTEIEQYKKQISLLREYRTALQNLEIKVDYHNNISKIDEAITALIDIRNHNKAKLVKKYSIELEKWTNIALNIINDSIKIKPNAPVGDDNEPTYTAPSGVADIECFYESFDAICEVTTLVSRDQWYNEGQPVMRHLRNFEGNSNKPCYCLFVAPSLHADTVNTFYTAVKYEYEGERQKIVPITINQLVSLLETIKETLKTGRNVSHKQIKHFYDLCIDTSRIQNSTLWLDHISNVLERWEQSQMA